MEQPVGCNVKAGGLDFKVRGEETRDAILIDQVVTPNFYRFPDNMEGQVVFDVGGHIGAVALMCAKRGAVVYTFEPERETYQILLANMDSNIVKGSIISFNMAIGKAGLQKLYHHPTQRGVASFYPDINQLSELYEHVWSVTLKEAIDYLGYPDVLKLDCEGSEIDILPEVIDQYHKYIPQVLVEFHQAMDAIKVWLSDLEKYYHVTPLSHIEYSFQRR